MKIIGIVGVGSPFGSDAIGQRVIGLLQKRIELQGQYRDQIVLDYYDRPGPYLLEIMKDFYTVHLIDAIVSNQPIGTLHRYENIEAFQKDHQLLSSHGFGLAETLALGEILECLPDKVIIHGIEVGLKIKADDISEEIIKASQLLANIIFKEIIPVL